MEWVFNTFSEYLENDFKKTHWETGSHCFGPLASLSGAFSCYVGATPCARTGGQYGTFKPLAFYHADEMGPLIEAPLNISGKFRRRQIQNQLLSRYAVHRDINFKPEGPEIWRELPELEGNPVSD